MAEIARRLTPPSMAEPGVKLFLTYRSPTNPSLFFIFELYVNEAALTDRSVSRIIKARVRAHATASGKARPRPRRSQRKCPVTLCALAMPRLRRLEHGVSPDAAVRKWQDWLTPLWCDCAGGCHLNRKTDDLVRAAGFNLTELSIRAVSGPWHTCTKDKRPPEGATRRAGW